MTFQIIETDEMRAADRGQSRRASFAEACVNVLKRLPAIICSCVLIAFLAMFIGIGQSLPRSMTETVPGFFALMACYSIACAIACALVLTLYAAITAWEPF